MGTAHHFQEPWRATISAEITIKIPNWLERIAVFLLLLYRRLRFGYPFRKIPLTKGKFAIVDPEDYDELMKFKWQVMPSGPILYAKRSARSPKTRKSTTVIMHRTIFKPPAGMVIDHINFNGLDNRKANLRYATIAQNIRHRRKFAIPSKSIYKGVSRVKGNKPWKAMIGYNRKCIYLGQFKDEAEAARAYDKAARKYHKEFAALNFPNPPISPISKFFRPEWLGKWCHFVAGCGILGRFAFWGSKFFKLIGGYSRFMKRS